MSSRLQRQGLVWDLAQDGVHEGKHGMAQDPLWCLVPPNCGGKEGLLWWERSWGGDPFPCERNQAGPDAEGRRAAELCNLGSSPRCSFLWLEEVRGLESRVGRTVWRLGSTT